MALQTLMAAPMARSAPCAASSSSSSAAASRLAAARPAADRRPQLRSQQPSRGALQPARAMELLTLADLDIDWSDTDTQIGALGAVLGLGLGIGAPMFYASRDERDEARLEELRALNRATKEETGEYMSQEEINAIRPPRWTGGAQRARRQRAARPATCTCSPGLQQRFPGSWLWYACNCSVTIPPADRREFVDTD